MKRLYFEFFHISKHGKVREKVMLTRIAVSIATILACMAAMSFAAYAYFSYGLSSFDNTITAANYELEVTQNENAVTKPYEISGTTEFVIKPTEQTKATVGFCRITIATDLMNGDIPVIQEFYTEPIWRVADEASGKVASRTIKIIIPEEKTATVCFTAEWGTYAGTAITENSIGDTGDADIIKFASSTNSGEAEQNETPQVNTSDVENTDSTTGDTPATQAESNNSTAGGAQISGGDETDTTADTTITSTQTTEEASSTDESTTTETVADENTE